MSNKKSAEFKILTQVAKNVYNGESKEFGLDERWGAADGNTKEIYLDQARIHLVSLADAIEKHGDPGYETTVSEFVNDLRDVSKA